MIYEEFNKSRVIYYHKNMTRFKQNQPITRSVGVSYLSRYLQVLTLTDDITLKHYKHLKPFIIVTRYLSQPHPTLQITRHTRLATGTNSWLKNRDAGRIASPGNVIYLNCRAVTTGKKTLVPLSGWAKIIQSAF